MILRIPVAVLMVCSARLAVGQEMLIPSDQDASAQVARIVASARSQGLPTNPIVGKVNYGVRVTRAPAGKIVESAKLIATRLEIAREALQPNPTVPEIEGGAAALGENATTESLKAVRSAGGSRSVATALGVLTQLLANKMPIDSATKIVTDLLRRGATPEQLVAFQGNVSADVARGYDVMEAADLRARGLVAAMGSGTASGAFTSADVEASAVTSGRNNPPGTPPKTPPRRP